MSGSMGQLEGLWEVARTNIDIHQVSDTRNSLWLAVYRLDHSVNRIIIQMSIDFNVCACNIATQYSKRIKRSNSTEDALLNPFRCQARTPMAPFEAITKLVGLDRTGTRIKHLKWQEILGNEPFELNKRASTATDFSSLNDIERIVFDSGPK